MARKNSKKIQKHQQRKKSKGSKSGSKRTSIRKRATSPRGGGSQKRLSGIEKMVLTFFSEHRDMLIPPSILESALVVESGLTKEKVQKIVGGLVAKEALIQNEKGLLSLNEAAASVPTRGTFQGTLSLNQYGTGFISCEAFDRDVKVLNKHLGTALPNDTVEFQIVTGKRSSDRVFGKITRIVERNTRTMVGVLKEEVKGAFTVIPDDKNASIEFYVLEQDIHHAQPNDKVAFVFKQWDHAGSLPQAVITHVLGKQGSHEAEMQSILIENNIKSGFSAEVISFVTNMPKAITEQEIARRTDLRGDIIFTIDPEDAKDFDDALSIKLLENKNYELGVHIADVSHFVTKGTVLDESAVERGTSTYLVDRVIPMLPEELSNGLCSLNPHEDTLTFSCIMEVTPGGKVVTYRIEETVIHSKERFTYEQAQQVIEGGDHKYKDELMMLLGLSKTLTRNRFKQGSIDFDQPEPRFVLDEKGNPIDVYVKERLDAHRLIEECMLLANKTVSEHIESLRKQGKGKSAKQHFPFIYRIHDKPNVEKLQNLSELLRPMNIDFTLKENAVDPASINGLIREVKGTGVEYIVTNLLLRSMAKAEYSPSNIGHFGLGFKYYTHFTSPIRRYPDLIVHRLLKAYAQEKSVYTYDELASLGKHCSECERGAMTAERDSVKLKQVEYLAKHIGDEFEGIISGVTDNGLYVQLKANFCEGMVPVREMNDDYYVFHEREYALVGRRRNKSYRLGADVRVKVVSANVEQKTVDFTLAG